MAITLTWDPAGERIYENGVDRGVLYVKNPDGSYPLGVPWNGLISVSENPEGAEQTDLWANNRKYGTLMSPETVGGTIEAYTYPEEFGVCDGSEAPQLGMYLGQQKRKSFGLSYRTKIHSDAGEDVGYKLHIVYGCVAAPSEQSHTTLNDSPEAATFSWDFKSTPEDATAYKPVSSITIDSTKVAPSVLTALEAILYGSDVIPINAAYLPLPDEILALT